MPPLEQHSLTHSTLAELAVLQRAGAWKTPRVLRNFATARRWAASGLFAPESLARQLRGVDAKWSAQPFFMYESGSAELLRGGDAAFASVRLERGRLDGPEFVRRAVASNGGDFVYLTEELRLLSPEIEQQIAQEWRRLLLGPDAQRDAAPSLWVGSAGVVTPLHYDAPANVFVQLYGNKAR